MKFFKYCRAHNDDIGEIFITLDSHHKRHIAHKAFWSNKENDFNSEGTEPEKFTTITEKDLQDGKWFPKDCSLQVVSWNNFYFVRGYKSLLFSMIELLHEVYK